MKFYFYLIFGFSFCFPIDHLGVKCPFDQTFIKDSKKDILSKNSSQVLNQFECGGLKKHRFFVKENQKKSRSLENIADNILKNLPKPRENATLQELALYNRIMILLTWISLQSSDYN
ncbi:MAG: hypothetical protein CMG04_04580 [Candidatus Marinimicrobia bacterium]|nr:hypothetical protein [Candidatus Neomarinimicrobiota bacterium]